MKRGGKRRILGYSLTELAFGLAIFGLVMLGVMRLYTSLKETENLSRERYHAYVFERGVKTAFVAILDAFESVCGRIASDWTADYGWGWGNPACVNTSPLPVYAGADLIRYDVDLASLPATARASLTTSIRDAFGPWCRLQGTTATTLTLLCPGVVNLQYDAGAGLVARYHVPGTPLDSRQVPTVVLTVRRRYESSGAVEQVVYRISLADVWEERRAYSRRKLYEVVRALRDFYNTKLTRETENTAPTGLNSADDVLVPWFWEVFGDDAAQVQSALCNRAGGVCANLNTNNIWRSALARRALFWRRIVQNIASIDWRHTVDGFGNPLNIYPILSQCPGLRPDTCAVNAPPVPQSNYDGVSPWLPPFSTAVYTQFCNDLTVAQPDYCRVLVVY
ncbi:hypothetical protein [Thermosulfurimonas sp. F29]|uniref:hypothetical protein n=1 Tax=Thermosulfurimonas sp. F29 TaxID=2867247 RepID=UPI001C8295F7|nr:hypothetical protein [Thermosulfurimonas sp. F29]MBX6424114.1 hypothetical protein [Thermosulfurimonas sp. F29]